MASAAEQQTSAASPSSSPSTTKSSTAAQKVLDVPELAGHILLDLPCADLFAVQRVSKSIKNNIAGSPKLQRAMCLEYGKQGHTNDYYTDALSPLAHILLQRAGLTLERGKSFDPMTGLLHISLCGNAGAVTARMSLSEFGRYDASWWDTLLTKWNVDVAVCFKMYAYGLEEERLFHLNKEVLGGKQANLGQLFDMCFVMKTSHSYMVKKVWSNTFRAALG